MRKIQNEKPWLLKRSAIVPYLVGTIEIILKGYVKKVYVQRAFILDLYIIIMSSHCNNFNFVLFV